MVKIDITLRSVISKLPHKFIEILIDKKGKKLLDTALPNVKDKRADLLVELEDDFIFHLEIQSQNEKEMPIRMLEYYLLIRQKFKTNKIMQMVLYVGKDNLTMPNHLKENSLDFKYIQKDIREINCKELLVSDDLDDKILAVLCNIENENIYLNTITKELLKLNDKEKKDYIKKLLSLSRYRPKINEKLIHKIKEEVMPIVIDLKNDPYFIQGIQTGKEKGKIEGKIESAITFIKDFNLPIEEVSKRLHIPVETIKEALKNK